MNTIALRTLSLILSAAGPIWCSIPPPAVECDWEAIQRQFERTSRVRVPPIVNSMFPEGRCAYWRMVEQRRSTTLTDDEAQALLRTYGRPVGNALKAFNRAKQSRVKKSHE